MIAGTERRRQGCSLQRCKQWGNLWAGYTEVLNWYFPLTTSQVYAVCLTKHTKNISSGHNWEPARIEEWNNSYARIHPDGDLGYSVIAICKAQQQWGVGAASTNIMLPIPYTKVKFITLATSSMLNPSQGNISVAYHDSTLDSIRFQIRWQGLAAEYTGAWLTLGI